MPIPPPAALNLSEVRQVYSLQHSTAQHSTALVQISLVWYDIDLNFTAL